MLEIKGNMNTAICFTKVIEDDAVEQIRRMCDYALTEGSRVRIMPDVHAGKGCTIGTTMTVINKVCVTCRCFLRFQIKLVYCNFSCINDSLWCRCTYCWPWKSPAHLRYGAW